MFMYIECCTLKLYSIYRQAIDRDIKAKRCVAKLCLCLYLNYDIVIVQKNIRWKIYNCMLEVALKRKRKEKKSSQPLRLYECFKFRRTEG